MQNLECDILVAGGGLGGIAAALAAARSGKRILLLEQTAWIGGQMTAQAVSAPDEHRYIETFGGTSAYYALRRLIRRHYAEHHDLTEAAARQPYLNPGNAWVSQVPFEPPVGVQAMMALLQTYLEHGQITVLLHTRVNGLQMQGDRIASASALQSLPGKQPELIVIRAGIVLDATETGDLLPLSGCEYVTGSEGRDAYDEPHGTDEPDRDLVQSFTYPFIVEFCQGQDWTISKPPDYERWHALNRYTLMHWYRDRGWVRYGFFEHAPQTPGSFWSYRRLVASENFGDVANDIAMINWPGNDFAGGNILDVTPHLERRLLNDAKNFSLGFLYWLQTECPRDGGGSGYPELKLRADLTGTADGLAMSPYIRESRRIRAVKTITEQEVSANYRKTARAAYYPDSAGIGWYMLDLHRCHWDDQGIGEPTVPFQIALGALLPLNVSNLLPACKNIGTTHVTNGCYRLHPVEWAIGEAAGSLAAFALDLGVTPHRVREDVRLLRAYQHRLLQSGVPLYWYVDVPLEHPAFQAAQYLALLGIYRGDAQTLRFEPDAAVSADERSAVQRQLPAVPANVLDAPNRGLFVTNVYAWLRAEQQEERLIHEDH